MRKNIYVQPVVEEMSVYAISKVCGESFFDPLSIGDPANPGNGR